MSGRKNTLYPYKAISAGDMSQASITSSITDILFLDNIGLQMNWTGTPTGTFSVQVSNDYVPGPQGQPALKAGNWNAYTLSPALGAPSGSAGTTAGSLTGCPFRYVKLVYTKTSGTGSLDFFISGKAL